MSIFPNPIFFKSIYDDFGYDIARAVILRRFLGANYDQHHSSHQHQSAQDRWERDGLFDINAGSQGGEFGYLSIVPAGITRVTVVAISSLALLSMPLLSRDIRWLLCISTFFHGLHVLGL